MPPNHGLQTYLGDHLGGAAAGVEIARRLARAYAKTPVEGAFRNLVVDIEADRDTLAKLLERLGGHRNPLKEAVGWVAEKVARVKLSPLTRDAQVARLLELETLEIGITGKLALWRALESAIGSADVGVDLELLKSRADEQRSLVEHYRLEEARAALVLR